ncbi:hypothetical protein HID58_082518 [Brassica napus]|uniref:FBD domain-containing protein n=1 Tax=Brassica napus TaxID=3708 RepID=A0ABQ7YAV7_BRANA|nr:hypothetical protein HID58_082518 [Brassica napus]
MPTFLVPLPSSAPRNQVTPRLSLVLYRRKSQPVLSNPLHPPEPPDPPDPTITLQPPPSSSVNTSPPQSPSLFCARPSSISVQSTRSLPSPFRFHLSLHNKVSKLVPVWRSLADSWEVADASMLESPTPQGHVNQNRQPLPFVGLHQLDLPMSQPYKCWLSLMVSFPHWQRLTPQPDVRSQELEHQLECYFSSSATRVFLVSLQDNFVDVSVLMWLAVLKPLSLQYTTFRSLGDWILDVDRLVVECFVATVLLNRCSLDAFWFVSTMRNISRVSVYSRIILKPYCSTGNSTSFPCSSSDSSFTEASCQFIGCCFASVYRVHLAQSRDDVLDFASLFFQPSQARRVYTAASPLLMNIRSKFRQIRHFPTVKVTRSAPSSAQIRIRHAPRFQQDSNLIIYVEYADNKVSSLTRLLSGCPNLDSLFLVHDNLDVALMVPSLRKLRMYNNGRYQKGGGFVIDAPSLVSLYIRDYVLYHFHRIEHMPKLEEAHVDMIQTVRNYKFLKAFTCARSLTLCLSFSEVLSPCGMIFHNLVYLTLNTCFLGWWDLLTHMLQDSPKLGSLKLIDEHELAEFTSIETPDSWKRPSSVPTCLLHSFEIFEWKGYKGRRGDVDVATYLIANATRLKKSKFSSQPHDDSEGDRIHRDLNSLQAASSHLMFLS